MSVNNSSLFRQLDTLDVFCITAGAMISSGLFILPGLVYAKIGPAVIVAYILAGLFVLPALFAKIELITAMPRAGGSYFFIERSMGSLAGTMGGFASWFSLSLKSAFSLIGIGVFATLINPNISEMQIKLIALGFCALFTILNLISVKLTGRVQIFLVILLIILLSLYAFRGMLSINVSRYSPFMPYGRHELLAAVGMVFVSFGGLTKVASIAEEVENPKKNIPFGMILAFCVVMLLYGLTIFVTVGLLDSHEFAHSQTPLSQGGNVIFGFAGSVIMAFAAILAFISTANAGILSASRFPLALSRDQLLPDFFAQVNKRFNTPHFSVLFTGIFMASVIYFLNLENLVKVASAMKIILFIFVIFSCIIMRESRILNYKPSFLSPLYPWIHITGIIIYGFLLFEMGNIVLFSTAGFIAVSILWHRIYVRSRAKRKSALIHIVERITAKEINGDTLANELREILQERDEIIEDKFDRMVKECEILDMEGQISSDEFFEIVSEKLSKLLDTETNKLVEMFIAREKESTTVIRPGLAIPHIIVEGEDKFELVIARNEAGICFPEISTPVYAIFILIGSRDKRNFHLRALSAIAQVTQDVNFDKEWLRAKSTDELRDIVLLAKRRRDK
ncbi:amino acid permease [Candidatus Latescibacterota bacterium]